jgi:multicomponent Na+:H+ antiporter subunit G
MHAATEPQVLVLPPVLLGCALRLRTSVDITTLVLIGAFHLTTAPVAAHMVGRAARRNQQLRPDLLIVDELPTQTEQTGRDGGPGPGSH